MGSLAGVAGTPPGRPGLLDAATVLPLGLAAVEAMDDASEPPPIDGHRGGPRAGGVRGLAASRRAFAGFARRAGCRAHGAALGRFAQVMPHLEKHRVSSGMSDERFGRVDVVDATRAWASSIRG